MTRTGLKIFAICQFPRASVLIAVAFGALLPFCTAPMLATEQATEAQILEALKAKRLMRCPSASEATGCGGRDANQQPAATPGLDVDIFFERASARLNPKAISSLANLPPKFRAPKPDGASTLSPAMQTPAPANSTINACRSDAPTRSSGSWSKNSKYPVTPSSWSDTARRDRRISPIRSTARTGVSTS